MKTARKELEALLETWELKVSQARRDDRISPNVAEEFRRDMYAWMASTIRICARDASKWTKRFDDAKRIPDVLHESADWLYPISEKRGER